MLFRSVRVGFLIVYPGAEVHEFIALFLECGQVKDEMRLDRYLSGFQGVKIGVNYSDCVRPRLIGGRYDVPIDVLVTDRYIRRCCMQKCTSAKRRRKGKETSDEKRKG